MALRRPQSPAEWHEQAAQIEAFALEAPWIVGDWLRAADDMGLRDARSEQLKKDPRWEGTECAMWEHVAESFPKRVRGRAPFNYYAAVVALPQKQALALIGEAMQQDDNGERWTLAELRKAAGELKKELKAADA